MRNKKAGYTLVEVLVCILIIGLIVGTGLLLYVRSTNVKLNSTKNYNIANRIEDIFNEFETDNDFYTNFMNSSNSKTIYYDSVFQDSLLITSKNRIEISYSVDGEFIKIDVQVYDNNELFTYLDQSTFTLKRHLYE